MLAGADDKLVDVTFEYGRNIGLAFQLVDDLLDFVSSKDAMGKPTAADLKLGLATAPVLFACEKVSLTMFSMHTHESRVSGPFRVGNFLLGYTELKTLPDSQLLIHTFSPSIFL